MAARLPVPGACPGAKRPPARTPGPDPPSRTADHPRVPGVPNSHCPLGLPSSPRKAAAMTGPAWGARRRTHPGPATNRPRDPSHDPRELVLQADPSAGPARSKTPPRGRGRPLPGRRMSESLEQRCDGPARRQCQRAAGPRQAPGRRGLPRPIPVALARSPVRRHAEVPWNPMMRATDRPSPRQWAGNRSPDQDRHRPCPPRSARDRRAPAHRVR